MRLSDLKWGPLPKVSEPTVMLRKHKPDGGIYVCEIQPDGHYINGNGQKLFDVNDYDFCPVPCLPRSNVADTILPVPEPGEIWVGNGETRKVLGVARNLNNGGGINTRVSFVNPSKLELHEPLLREWQLWALETKAQRSEQIATEWQRVPWKESEGRG